MVLVSFLRITGDKAGSLALQTLNFLAGIGSHMTEAYSRPERTMVLYAVSLRFCGHPSDYVQGMRACLQRGR